VNSKRVRNLIIVFSVLIISGVLYFGLIIRNNKNTGAVLSGNIPAERIGNLDYSKIIMIEFPDFIFERNETVPGTETWELISLNGEIPKTVIELDQFLMEYLTWSLSSVWVDSVVEDDSENNFIDSIYGFDNPVSWVIITDSDGVTDRYMLGDFTPARTSYYLKQEGNPKVYTISVFSAEIFTFTLDQIRLKIDFPHFDFLSVNQLRLELPHTIIDIDIMPDLLPYRLSSSNSLYRINSPYTLSRSIDIQAFSDLVEQINSIHMVDFIDDVLPPETYGFGTSTELDHLKPEGQWSVLDKPSRIFVQSGFETLDLLIGNKIDNNYYAKPAHSDQIVTISGLDKILRTEPFTLTDKFALLLNIYSVKQLTISGSGFHLNAEILVTNDDEIFYLNGKKAEEKSFKSWYQSVIGLLVDAQLPENFILQTDGSENITIEYQLNLSSNVKVSITLIPYDRDFYILNQDGVMEFLISRNQVNRIWETVNEVIYN